jgi:hypothetical protein
MNPFGRIPFGWWRKRRCQLSPSAEETGGMHICASLTATEAAAPPLSSGPSSGTASSSSSLLSSDGLRLRLRPPSSFCSHRDQTRGTPQSGCLSLSFSGASSCPWSFFRSSSKADYYTRTVRCMIGSQNPHQLAPRLCTFGQQSDFHAHNPPKKPIIEKSALKSCILGALRRCLCTEILA